MSSVTYPMSRGVFAANDYGIGFPSESVNGVQHSENDST